MPLAILQEPAGSHDHRELTLGFCMTSYQCSVAVAQSSMEKLPRSKSASCQYHCTDGSECAGKRSILARTMERCRFLRRPRPAGAVPAGCFAVLVGPEKERFAVRAESANHPLFRALLDEAEAEYGFPLAGSAGGPLELPCGVDAFRRVMWEVEQDRAAASSPSPAGRSWKGSRAGYKKMNWRPEVMYSLFNPA